MALTNYMTHSVIGLVIFVLAGYYGQLGVTELFLIVPGICLFQLALSHFWLKKFLYDPLEWLWRGITYGRFSKLVR